MTHSNEVVKLVTELHKSVSKSRAQELENEYSFLRRGEVAGHYYKLDESGEVEEHECHRMKVMVGDAIRFIDNSIIHDCPANKQVYYAGTYTTHGMNGVVTKIDSGMAVRVTGLFNRIVELPIVVLADNGDTVYVNPLNIRTIN
jgi:hypothetical protein